MNTKLLSRKEFQQMTGLGNTKTHELIAKGEVASFKIGGRRVIPQTALAEYIDRRLAEEQKTAKRRASKAA